MEALAELLKSHRRAITKDTTRESIVISNLSFRDSIKQTELYKDAHIRKHHREPWTIITLDNIGFMEATWATTSTTFTTRKYGFPKDATLCNRQQQLKLARNTLAIIWWDYDQIKEVADAIHASVDQSVWLSPASCSLLRPLDKPHRVITPDLKDLGRQGLK